MIQLGTFARSKVMFAYQSYYFNPSLWLWSLQLPQAIKGEVQNNKEQSTDCELLKIYGSVINYNGVYYTTS